MREFGLYNINTEEFEEHQFLTQETADFLNDELYEKGIAKCWIHEEQEIPCNEH